MSSRIVLLSAFLSPLRSGAEAMVEEVAARLGGEFDVTIVTAKMKRELKRKDYLTPLPNPPPTGEGTARGVQVIRVGIGRPVDKRLFPFLAPFIVRKLQPDIVHAVLESYAGLALVFCRLVVPRAKRLLTCQSTNTTLLVGLMHRSAHVVTVISRVLLERAERFGKEATLIPNGIDLKGIRTACKEHPKVPGRLLFVGRLERMKGVDTLLTAFAKSLSFERSLSRVQSRGASSEKENSYSQLVASRSQLIVVGSGSLRPSLERLARELGIADRVTFTGYLSGAALFKEYAEAEIFVGLSRSEALGNVFLEAQAAGCAVIATKVGGIPDIVEDGVTGFLVPPDDPTAAAQAVAKLLTDAELRKGITRRGIEHAARYDWDAIAERYGEVYRRFVP